MTTNTIKPPVNLKRFYCDEGFLFDLLENIYDDCGDDECGEGAKENVEELRNDLENIFTHYTQITGV